MILNAIFLGLMLGLLAIACIAASNAVAMARECRESRTAAVIHAWRARQYARRVTAQSNENTYCG